MKSFLKRNERLLMVIGTVIVLATFVLKEQLGASWKGKADAIESAQRTYISDVSSEKTKTEVQAILKSADTQDYYKQRLGKRVMKIIADSAPLRIKASELNIRIQNLQVLNKNLPRPRVTPENFSFLSYELKLWGDVYTTLRKARERAEPLPPSILVPSSENGDMQLPWLKSEKEFVDSQNNKLSEIEADVDRYEKQILEDASVSLDEYRTDARQANWISSILYVLGLTLGFVSKFYAT